MKRNVFTNARVRRMNCLQSESDMYSVNVQKSCEGPSYSFSPYSNDANRTMIDHIIIPTGMADLLKMCSILGEHELNSSDHLPIIVQIDTHPISFKRKNFVRVKYNWSKLTANEISQSYGDELYSSLQSLPLSHHELGNNDTEMYHKTFVSKLQSASASTLPKCGFKNTLSQNGH